MSLTDIPNRTALSVLLALVTEAHDDHATPGLNLLLATSDLASSVRAVAVFEAVPSADEVRALERLGLSVQPMKHLALANIAGPVSAMQTAVRDCIVRDIHPDERMEDRHAHLSPVRQARRSVQSARIEHP
jgi:hypothetical protein